MRTKFRYNPLTDKVIAALILVQVLFGMNYLFSKLILDSIPPLVWASLRAVATAVILTVISLARGKLDVPRGLYYYRQLFLFSLLGVAFNQGLFLLGLQYTTPTNSAIVNTLIPVFTVLIVVMRGQESISKKRALGFFFAFIGVLFIHRVQDLNLNSKTFLGDLLILLNTFSYSFFLTYSHRFFEKVDPIWSTTWLFIYGSLQLSVLAIPSFISFTFPTITMELGLTMLMTILGATVLPYVLISYTLGRTHSSVVALFIYIQPLVAAVLSFLMFGEEIPTRSIVAGLLVFVGVLLATSKSAEIDSTNIVTLDFEETNAVKRKKIL